MQLFHLFHYFNVQYCYLFLQQQYSLQALLELLMYMDRKLKNANQSTVIVYISFVFCLMICRQILFFKFTQVSSSNHIEVPYPFNMIILIIRSRFLCYSCISFLIIFSSLLFTFLNLHTIKFNLCGIQFCLFQEIQSSGSTVGKQKISIMPKFPCVTIYRQYLSHPQQVSGCKSLEPWGTS